MPSNHKVVVSPRAADDIRDILQYTFEQWGAKQRDALRKRLTAAIRQLGRYPLLGQRRNDLGVGYRRRAVDPHVTYYRLDGDVVRVLRVLHSRRDAPALLGNAAEPTSEG